MPTYQVTYRISPQTTSKPFDDIDTIVYYVEAASIVHAQTLFREYALEVYAPSACVEVTRIIKLSYW